MKKTEYCCTIGEIEKAKGRWGRSGIRLDIYLVCYKCNIIIHSTGRAIAIRGEIHCWKCYIVYVYDRMGETNEEKLLTFLKPFPTVADLANLYKFWNQCSK